MNTRRILRKPQSAEATDHERVGAADQHPLLKSSPAALTPAAAIQTKRLLADQQFDPRK